MTAINISLNTLVEAISEKNVLISLCGRETFNHLKYILHKLDIKFEDVYAMFQDDTNNLYVDIHTINRIIQTAVNSFKIETDELDFMIQILA